MHRLLGVTRRVPPAAWTALLALVVALVLTHGLWGAPGSREIAGNPHDVDLYTNYLQHAAYSVVHGQSPFYVHTLRVPLGVNAMWNTSLILPGLLMTPVTLLAGPLATYDLLLLVSLVATAGGGHVLARRFVTHDVAAALGALLFAFSPAVIAAEQGHASFVLTALVPPILLAVDSLVRGTTSPRRAGATLGLLCVAQLLTGEELLFGTALFTGLALLTLALRRPRAVRPLLRRLGVGTGAAAATFLVLAAYPLWVQFLGPIGQHGTPFPGDYFVTDLRTFVTPSGRYLLSTQDQADFARSYVGGAPEYVGYLGVPLILAVLATLVTIGRRPVVLALGVATALLAVASLGGHLLLNGDHTHTTLPWELFKQLPVGESALANRFALFVDLGVAGLMALALDAVITRGDPFVLGAAGGLLLITVATLVPRPYEVAQTTPIPAFFGHVTDVLPRGTTALVLPYPDPSHTEAMRWQAASDMAFAMPGGYFIGPDAHGVAKIGGAEHPLATARLLSDVESDGSLPFIGDGERQQLDEDLGAWGATAILVGPSDEQAATIRAVTLLTEETPRMDGGVAIWRR